MGLHHPPAEPTSVAPDDAVIHTVSSAAHELGVTERHVRRLCAAGVLPHFRYSARTIRIAHADLEQFRASHRVEAA